MRAVPTAAPKACFWSQLESEDKQTTQLRVCESLCGGGGGGGEAWLMGGGVGEKNQPGDGTS